MRFDTSPHRSERGGPSPSVYLDEATGATRASLQRIDDFLAAKQWTEAVDVLMRITDRAADTVVRVGHEPSEFQVFVSLQAYLQQRLCSLPAESRRALEIYRNRVDAHAHQWYRQGVAEQNREPLERIVNRMFACSYGDEALLHLGDFAMQRGSYTAARRFYERLHAGLRWSFGHRSIAHYHALRGCDLDVAWPEFRPQIFDSVHVTNAYPDADVRLVDVWARLVITSALEGHAERARFELSLLRRFAPGARGLLAGREVAYEEALERFIEESQDPPTSAPMSDWRSFAGNVARNHVAAESVDIALRPVWSTPFSSQEFSPNPNAEQFQAWAELAVNDGESCRYHPIVVGDLVLSHEPGGIRCLDLLTGQPAWEGSPAGWAYVPTAKDPLSRVGNIQPLSVLATPRRGNRAFTLTVQRDLLLACVHADLSEVDSPPGLIALDLSAEAAIRFGPLMSDEIGWTMHGAAVSDGELCWVGMRKEGLPIQEYVACFDATRGLMLWRRRICSAESVSRGESVTVPNSLLTYHDGVLYYNSNSGAIASLAAVEGTVNWIATYPRFGSKRANLLDRPWHVSRSLTPCLFYRGLVVSAPSDFPGLFALDSNTGQLVWQTDVAGDVVHLLGAVDDHLIVSGKRLWWLDAYTGELSTRVPNNPFPSGHYAMPRGFGRGALAAGNVYWPTRGEISEIFVFDQRTGKQVRQPINLSAAGASAGNLVIARGHLLVAAPDKLYVFNATGCN